LELFRRIGKPKPAVANPHEWATTVVRILKDNLADHLVAGIQYERTDGWYDMSQILDAEEIDLFSKYIVETDGKPEKCLYDQVPCDSEVERQFVKDLEARRDVKCYLKLPSWFTVPTPVGEYQPDWAVVMQDNEADKKPVLYLVSETKSSIRKDDMRPDEWRKLQCGAAHFGSKQFKKKGALENVDYKLVTSASELP
jgi:type III restriction enzyme